MDHSFTCNYTNACLYLVSVHQMAPLKRLHISNCSLSRLLIYLPWKDERLSRPGWLTYSRRFTHISGHPSAAGQVERRTGKVCQSKTDVLPLCHATNQLVRVYLYFPSSCGHKYYTTTIWVWCEYSTTTITITIRLRHEAMTTNWHVNFFDFSYSIVACCSELVASSCRNRVIVVTYFFSLTLFVTGTFFLKRSSGSLPLRYSGVWFTDNPICILVLHNNWCRELRPYQFQFQFQSL